MKLVHAIAGLFSPRISAPARSPSSVLDHLSRTPFGRVLSSRFSPLLESGRVATAPYPDEILEKLRSSAPGLPTGASFVHDGLTGTLYYDASTPLALACVLFAHEIAHALDANTWRAARFTGELRSRFLASSEENAYACQHLYLSELARLDPPMHAWLKKNYGHVAMIFEKPTAADIAEMVA